MGGTSKMMLQKTTYGQIEELYLMCFRETCHRYIEKRNASQYILQLLAQFEVLTEVRNDKVVGCIIYQIFQNPLHNEKQCFIHEWFIHPDYRNKTVGMKLYKRLCEKGKELGCARLIGSSCNNQMIRTIERRNAAKVVAKIFEKEL